MKIIDIINIIEKIAPLAAAAPWDASGVQTASRRERISRLAVLLDPTLPALTNAVHDGADFILTHHPLSLHPRFPNVADTHTDILALLLGKGIWLYSAHTSLDGNPDGPVRWLADDLGLTQIRLLEAAPDARYGFGFAGLLPAPVTGREFHARLRELIPTPPLRCCGILPESVRRVACCPGAGGDLIALARAAEAEVFITGDLKYHSALEASDHLPCVLDVGHFHLEEEMMRRFTILLHEALPLPVTFYPGKDPFTYL